MLIAIPVIMSRKSRIVAAEALHSKTNGQPTGQSGREIVKDMGLGRPKYPMQ